jgi:hypothetical protein
VAKTLGLLMLDTRFPRVPGDVGHPATFPFPVKRAVVRGASPQRVVRERDPALLAPFVAAARGLVAEGCAAVTTSCGFLVAFQDALQAALPVPVWTSSLLLLPSLPQAGVITVDAASLALDGVPVEGLEPGCAFQRTLLEDLPALDEADARVQTLAAARRLVARSPAITDIVLECTNLPPHADAIRAATGRRVHDISTLVHERFAAL